MNKYIIEFFDEYSKYYTDQDLQKLKDLIEKELDERSFIGKIKEGMIINEKI